jgi:hypothetical protein
VNKRLLSSLQLVVGSLNHRTWALTSPTDAGKVRSEMAGIRRPLPKSNYAKGLVMAARIAWGNSTPAPPPSPVYTGIFCLPGALARNPRGGVEDIARYKQAGMRWVLCSLDYAPAEWQTVISRCRSNGLPVGFWFHCRTVDHVRSLLGTCMEQAVGLCGINVEAELATTVPPSAIAKAVYDSEYQGAVCTVLYGWVQNSVDCGPISRWPALLEMFPADAPDLAPPREKWPQCVEHAKQRGVKYPLQLAQCYRGGRPGWYDRPYSLYTLDDASGRIEEWL